MCLCAGLLADVRLAVEETVRPLRAHLAAVEREVKRARASVTTCDDLGAELVRDNPFTVSVDSIVAVAMPDILPEAIEHLQRDWEKAKKDDTLQVSNMGACESYGHGSKRMYCRCTTIVAPGAHMLYGFARCGGFIYVLC
jgi:hypothetical protein